MCFLRLVWFLKVEFVFAGVKIGEREIGELEVFFKRRWQSKSSPSDLAVLETIRGGWDNGLLLMLHRVYLGVPQVVDRLGRSGPEGSKLSGDGHVLSRDSRKRGYRWVVYLQLLHGVY